MVDGGWWVVKKQVLVSDVLYYDNDSHSRINIRRLVNNMSLL